MDQTDISDIQIIKRYLLGTVSEAEQKTIETRLLLDNDYFEQIKIVEDDLIEDYVGKRLNEVEQTSFERHFLASPDRRSTVAQAQLLRNYFFNELDCEKSARTGENSQETNWFGRWFELLSNRLASSAIVFALLLLAAFSALWFIYQRQRPEQPQFNAQNVDQNKTTTETGQELAINQPPEQTISNQNSGQSPAAEKELRGNLNQNSGGVDRSLSAKTNQNSALASVSNGQRLTKVPAQSSTKSNSNIISLALVAGQTMSANNGYKTVRLKPSSETLRLQLNFESNVYDRLEAELRTENDQIVWQKKDLKAAGKTSQSIFINLSTKNLSPAIYKATLYGVNRKNGTHERIGTYYFRVERK